MSDMREKKKERKGRKRGSMQKEKRGDSGLPGKLSRGLSEASCGKEAARAGRTTKSKK